MSSYAVATLDQIEEIDDGRSPWRPVRMHFGIQSFGINAFTGKDAGDRLINEHDETDNDGHEELYLVQSGRARFEIDGETVDAPAGTMVLAPPEVRRTAFAEEPGTTLIALGGTPGKAYEASACCESLAGRADDAIEHLRSAIELKPEFRELATDDSDFDPVRDEEAFRQLVG